MDREAKRMKVRSHPWWMQAAAYVLVPAQLLSTMPLLTMPVMAESVPTTTVDDHPAPVLTPQDVTVNRTVPNVTPPANTIKFSASPSDAEFFHCRAFHGVLLPMGGKTSAAENKDLAKALLANLRVRNPIDASVITGFLNKYPHTAWRASLLSGLGTMYRHAGYFSKAIAAWEEAWTLSSGEQGVQTRALADHVLGELVQVYAWSGNMDKLQALLLQIGDRQVQGAATEKLCFGRQQMDLMRVSPENTFKCGAYALGQMLGISPCGPTPEGAKLNRAQGTLNGMSLSQLDALARDVGGKVQMARRSPGSAVVVPSVMHWKLGHYSSLLQESNGRYLLGNTGPNIGSEGPQWICRGALDSEASGYFLVPAGKLPAGWQQVPVDEGNGVWGRGPTQEQEPDDDTSDDTTDNGCDPSTDCDCGMPICNVHSMLVSLNIHDTPIRYTPPRGAAIRWTITYNQRDVNQRIPFTYSNMGSKWTFNWLSYLTVNNVSDPTAGVKMAVRGGGGMTYTGYNSLTQCYAIQLKDQSVLAITGTNTYQCSYPDGSRAVYDIADTPVGGVCHVYLSHLIDPQNNTVIITYDGNFRAVALTDALGQVTNIAYENSADIYKITKVTDPFGRTAQFQYDSLGRLSSSTDIIGMTSTFAYVGNSDFICAMTTPYGTTKFQKTEGPGTTRALEVTNPMGQRKRTEYRDNAPGISTNDAAQNVPAVSGIENSYLQYRNTFYWDKAAMDQAPGDYTKAKIFHWLHTPDGTMTSGTLESEKTALENRIWYTYPNQNPSNPIYETTNMISHPSMVARVLDGNNPGSTTQINLFGYNSVGNVTQSVDPMGRTTTYTYSTNLIDLIQVQQQEINGGTTNSVTLSQIIYNNNHQPIQSTDASGQITTYGYNANGQITGVTNALNQVTTYNYTGNYLTSVVGADSVTQMSFTYDGFGRVRTTTDSAGYTLTFDYDNMDRPTKVTYPDGTYTQTVYDKLDPILQKDRIGRWTRTYYNAIRQVVAVENPLRQATSFSWCRCGALDSITDPAGHVTRWIRDIQGRPTKKVFPDQTSTIYNYEGGSSRLLNLMDGSGRVTSYQYNVDNSIQQVAYSGTTNVTPSVSYTYDPNYPRISTRTDGTGLTTYNYNAISGVLGSGKLGSVVGPWANSTIAYSYDALGRVTTNSINGVASTTGFDVLGRVNSVTNSLGGFSYTYVNSTARLNSVSYPNGQSTTFAYYNNTGDQRLQTLRNLTPSSSPLSKFDYEYNSAGQITKWTQQADAAIPNAYQLTYDSASQLVSAVLKNTSTGATIKQYAYAYDSAANRTSEQIDGAAVSATVNSLNQMTSRQGGGQMRFRGVLSEPSTVTVGGNAATVVAAGTNTTFEGFANVTVGTNLVPVVAKDYSGNARTNTYKVVVSSGLSGSQTLTYDLAGNLQSKVGAGVNVTYEWDAANRLTAINNGTHRTEMVYDGNSRRVEIIEKDNGTITSDKKLLWNGLSIAEQRDSTGAIVNKRYFAQGVQIGSTNYYYTRDHLGSIRELTDNTGAVQARYSYDPYGRRALVSGTDLADFGFTGHYYHQPSGLHLAPFRAYDTDLGRWLSRDIISENGGANLYAYCGGDPINRVDPLGLLLEAPVLAPVAAPVATAELATIPSVTIGASAAIAAGIGFGAGYIIGKYTGFHDWLADKLAPIFTDKYDVDWGAAREAYWKQRAANAEDGEFSDSDLDRMRKGLAPIDPETGAKMELHHKKPKCKGGSNDPSNLQEVWPWEHDDIDPYRHYTGPVPEGYERPE